MHTQGRASARLNAAGSFRHPVAPASVTHSPPRVSSSLPSVVCYAPTSARARCVVRSCERLRACSWNGGLSSIAAGKKLVLELLSKKRQAQNIVEKVKAFGEFRKSGPVVVLSLKVGGVWFVAVDAALEGF